MKKIQLISFFFLLNFFGAFGQTVPDSLLDNQKVKITLENGISKSGFLIYDTDEELKIWSEDFGFLKVPKIQIRKIEFIDIKSDNKKSDSEETDYLHHNAMTNSAFAPKKGDFYIRAPYFLAGCVDYGITDNLTVGLDAFYFVLVNLNLRYSFKLSENSKLALSLGSYYTYLVGGFSSDNSMLSARAVYSFGTADKNFSIGGTFLTNFQRAEIGVAHFSNMTRISNRAYFLADLSFAPDLRSLNIDVNYVGVGFIGIRFKTKKDNRIDLGFANIVTEYKQYSYSGGYFYERVFVPAPYVQVSYKL
jgi:hypothetical protein